MKIVTNPAESECLLFHYCGANGRWTSDNREALIEGGLLSAERRAGVDGITTLVTALGAAHARAMLATPKYETYPTHAPPSANGATPATDRPPVGPGAERA